MTVPGGGALLEKVREGPYSPTARPTSCSLSTYFLFALTGSVMPCGGLPHSPAAMVGSLSNDKLPQVVGFLWGIWTPQPEKQLRLPALRHILGPRQMETYSTAEGSNSPKATSKLVTALKLESRCSHAYHKSSEFQTRQMNKK